MQPNRKPMARVTQLLDYMATNPDAVIRFYASDIMLNVHSDVSYQTASRMPSRAGGYFLGEHAHRQDTNQAQRFCVLFTIPTHVRLSMCIGVGG